MYIVSKFNESVGDSFVCDRSLEETLLLFVKYNGFQSVLVQRAESQHVRTSPARSIVPLFYLSEAKLKKIINNLSIKK